MWKGFSCGPGISECCRIKIADTTIVGKASDDQDDSWNRLIVINVTGFIYPFLQERKGEARVYVDAFVETKSHRWNIENLTTEN